MESTMAQQLRSAAADDVPSLVALMTEFYAEADYPLPQEPATRAFHKLIAEPQWGGIWMAAEATSPVGYIVLTFSFSMEYGGVRGFVDDLYVQPQARGRGIGAALLSTVRSVCVLRGVRNLQVEIGSENGTARRLYQRAGYVERGHLLLSLPLAAPVHAT